ncbi:META domain-containing protein [Mucilaginibacter jinjuensis]|uniref:META domain-containing protein n=1 Tax=Mucilaginibacter jinjuensis TaxID=1176721 RepID=A0ABY7TFE8_9SPHI|nr:META domain-containing protein [Mucilaginibacter jinjuensis]WCT14814.1 META domain-containing protein [Mucilaginibacter jinjuensis]
MKKLILISFIACGLLIACHSAKKTTTANGADTTVLAGTWQLSYVAGSSTSFDSLYVHKKPTISFDLTAKRVSGNSGCNSFNGPLNVSGHKISFAGLMAMTKMFCPGDGENVFMSNLQKVNSWSVSDGKTLTFIAGDIAIMRFEKQ